MSDRFRFRVWSNLYHQYLENMSYPVGHSSFYIAKNGSSIEEHDDVWEFDKDGLVTEQCTGLKDKNDKLIFEGDVIGGLAYHNYGLIVWENGGFGFMHFSKTKLERSLADGNMWYDFVHFSGHSHLDEILKRFEVIGNVHEWKEPDLIE